MAVRIIGVFISVRDDLIEEIVIVATIGGLKIRTILIDK